MAITKSSTTAPIPKARPSNSGASTQNATAPPIPRPRPERPTPAVGDSSAISREAKESSTSNGSPVNFAAWDDSQVLGQASGVQAAGETPDLGDKTLRRGSRGEEVKALQTMLNEKLGLGLEVDGIFGGKTLEAVKNFQRENDLGVDGIVGKNTRGSLLGGETSPAPSPDPVGSASPDQGATVPPTDNAQQPSSENSGIPGLSDTSWTDGLPKNLKPHAQAFLDAGEKHKIDPRFLAAISMQETGGGTSPAFRNRNNAMGIMGRGGLRNFNSIADSINSQAHSMTRPGGYYEGKHTIANIGATYAPVGASNDPRGLNNHWVQNVSKFYQQLGGDASQRVSGF